MYKFDPNTVSLEWVVDLEFIAEPGGVDLAEGDLIIDTGDRLNTESIIDQGLR